MIVSLQSMFGISFSNFSRDINPYLYEDILLVCAIFTL